MERSKLLRAIIHLLLICSTTSSILTTGLLVSHDNFNERNFTAKDGIVLVDFWANRRCESSDEDFDNLAQRVNVFITNARAQGAKIFHALSDSHIWIGRANATLRSRYWPNDDGGNVLKEVRSYLLMSSATVSSPLDLFPLDNDPVYCNGTMKEKPSSLLHPAIHFDIKQDIIFDNKNHFRKIKATGVNRLYYAGMALQLCVLHTRRFSSLEAVFTGRFEEVGIILDLTIPQIRRRRIQPRCKGITDTDCVEKFVQWMSKQDKLGQISIWNSNIPQ